jgi:hypothetical protein
MEDLGGVNSVWIQSKSCKGSVQISYRQVLAKFHIPKTDLIICELGSDVGNQLRALVSHRLSNSCVVFLHLQHSRDPMSFPKLRCGPRNSRRCPWTWISLTQAGQNVQRLWFETVVNFPHCCQWKNHCHLLTPFVHSFYEKTSWSKFRISRSQIRPMSVKGFLDISKLALFSDLIDAAKANNWYSEEISICGLL